MTSWLIECCQHSPPATYRMSPVYVKGWLCPPSSIVAKNWNAMCFTYRVLVEHSTTKANSLSWWAGLGRWYWREGYEVSVQEIWGRMKFPAHYSPKLKASGAGPRLGFQQEDGNQLLQTHLPPLSLGRLVGQLRVEVIRNDGCDGSGLFSLGSKQTIERNRVCVWGGVTLNSSTWWSFADTRRENQSYVGWYARCPSFQLIQDSIKEGNSRGNCRHKCFHAGTMITWHKSERYSGECIKLQSTDTV